MEKAGGPETVFDCNPGELGSSRGLLNSSGTKMAAYTYDLYWAVTAKTGTSITPFQYAGQYTDAESGLKYLRNRYYDPATEQFITVDPIVGATDEPYNYTDGNPLNTIDPTGLCGWSDLLDCVVRGAVAVLKTQPVTTQVAVAWGLNGLVDTMGRAGRDLTSPDPAVKLLGVGNVYANVYLAFLPAAAGLQNLVRGADDSSCFVDLTTAERRTHIRDGDAWGGGHRFGTGRPGKSEFPASWSDNRIIHEISDVATDPASAVKQQGRATVIEGWRDGVHIRVIVRDGEIVTEFPINLPKNS